MRVLIISFDALEYDLVEKFNCQVLKQLEYGKIDLENYVSSRPEGKGSGEPITTEVFAIFFTGVVPNKEMGYSHIHDFIIEVSQGKHKTFFDTAKYPFAQDLQVIRGFGPKSHRLIKSWIAQVTSAPMFSGFFKNIFTIDDMEEAHFSYMNCKTKIYKAVSKLGHDIIMAYYKTPDDLQHCYAANPEYQHHYKTLYNVCENNAKELIDAYDDGETLILIMSDHGTNQKGGHSHHGFWSSNIPLNKGDSIAIEDWFDIINTWYGYGSVSNMNLNSTPITDKEKKIVAERLRKLGYVI